MSSSIPALEHLFSPEGSTPEQRYEAESCVVALVSRWVGYDEARSGGRVTASARAAVLAGLRVAIAKQAPESRRKGVPRNLYCFATEAVDDAVLEAVETTGLGGYHLIRVRTREDGSMDVTDLRAKMLAVASGGDVPLFVVARAGAEGSSALDDVKELRETVDAITTLYGLRPVHLHADAAWGGLYRVFNDYDFQGNPLGFAPPVLEELARWRPRLRHLHLADSVALDFRSLGRACFPAGLFLLGNGVELRSLGLRSLEAPGALALHAQLRAFGLEGCRRLLARRGEAEEARGLPSRLVPGVMGFSGARAPQARPRH